MIRRATLSRFVPFLLLAQSCGALDISIQVQDPQEEGFNDLFLGPARTAALERAVEIMEAFLGDNIDLILAASPYEPLMQWVGGDIFRDIAEGEEILKDLGYTINQPATSAAIAWVEFGFVGEEWGTEVLPFATLGSALSFVESGGTINIRPGESPEFLTIDQVVAINAVGGTATVGAIARP